MAIIKSILNFEKKTWGWKKSSQIFSIFCRTTTTKTTTTTNTRVSKGDTETLINKLKDNYLSGPADTHHPFDSGAAT